MAEYQSPEDICNRALQHIGAARITSLSDDTKNADECDFAYDKLRRAELQRNLWTFTTRRVILRPLDTTTMTLDTPAYSSTFVYQPGMVVSSGGAIWVNSTTFNVGNAPGVAGSGWDVYFGPLTVSLYVSGTAYYPGELVYVPGALAGLASIFAATDYNTDDPTVTATYAAATTYYRGQIVHYSGSDYISMVDLNLANTPASAHALWVAATTYAISAVVVGFDGRLYTSVANGNVGNLPAVGSAHWTAAGTPPYVQPWLAFSGGVSALTWRYIGNGISLELKKPQISYPAGSGPVSQDATRNIFFLPNGFLRMAPADPKAGSNSYLGAPSGLRYDDYVQEGKYIISQTPNPIMIRFVADMTNVPDLDSMFCEGLAARLGAEICEVITQSTDKVAECNQEYKRAMNEARGANAIELAPIEPAEDDYIACRI